jgi:hypothetical protein
MAFDELSVYPVCMPVAVNSREPVTAIELGQIIAVIDFRDDLTGFVALLINEVRPK